ncbi:MAG TPA: helix-turn-helix domain-containing protein [Xanthobacteraceae bacterium]|nr:helix-turn-helix domain-containing protein [Xanthobacteraceae bacterium]
MTGADLAATLAALGLTQEQFAEHIHRSRCTVNRWCNGRQPVPAWLTLALDRMQNKNGAEAVVDENRSDA